MRTPGVVLVLLTIFAIVGQGVGDEPAGDRGEAAVEAAKLFHEHARGYSIAVAEDAPDPFELRETPVLHWGNPERKGENGAMFVWLREGRPEVVGTIFTYQFGGRTHLKHELVSTSAGPLRAEFRGQLAWAPGRGGVVIQPIDGAPAPAETPTRRLAQMRGLAREFTASMEDLAGQTAQLRLMTQPLFRYQPEDGEVVDGAMFSFVVGTDPEVLLLIEARRDKTGKTQWYYGPARCHHVTLTVKHRGEAVWQAEPLPGLVNSFLGNAQFQAEPYISYHPNSTRGI